MLIFEGAIHSVNSLADIEPGIYKGVSEIYSPYEKSGLIFNKYGPAEQDLITIAELIVSDSEGDIYYLDFIRLPSKRWRDTYGLIRNNLIDLVPVDFSNLQLAHTFWLPEIDTRKPNL